MKVSLAQQIEELDREIGMRRGVYQRQVASGHMRQSIADFHMGRIQAARATLQWLANNEALIRGVVEAGTME